MSSITWSFYDSQSGEFHRRRFSAPNDADLATATPKGSVAIVGSFDPLTQRFDLATGVVVTWVNDRLAAELARAESRLAALARIDELERKQGRAMRENELNPSDRDQEGKTAKERLQAIDDEIAALRAQISG